MWIKKSVAIALCISCALGIAPVYARWHFHGGNVEDIPRRIKEAVDAAKESQVYTEFVALKDQYKEMREVWGEFHSAITGLSDTVSYTMHENPLSRLLTTGESQKQLKQDIDERYHFDLEGNKNTKETRQKALQKLMNVHNEEFMNTVQTAENTSKMSSELNQMANDISSDRSGAGYSAAQKDAVLELTLLNAKNQSAALENQVLMGEIEGDIMEDNFNTYSAFAGGQMDLNYPLKDDPVLVENTKKNRLTSLPR